MHYITEIGLTSRFFQVYHAYHTVYHKNSGTLPLTNATDVRGFKKRICERFSGKVPSIKVA